MKIHKITLKDYNQFKNLEIDLTYPQGHPKAGQPLDKVCFIGQSGTGKTSLLRLIKAFVTNNRGIGTNVEMPSISQGQVSFVMEFDEYFYESEPNDENVFIYNLKEENTTDEWFDEWFKAETEYKNNNKPLLINFPTERISGTNSEMALEKIKELPDEQKNKRINYLENLKLDLSVDFAFEDSRKAWDFVLRDIKEHQATDFNWRNTIAETVLNSNSVLSDFEKINQEYQLWLKENPSPLEKLAATMNEVLKELGVKIKTDIDKESILHLGSILLQTLDGVTLERNFWSTGTKQIVDTLMPLIELKPKNAVILIDEPERSLYPNMQQKIIDLYTAQGTDCQFFFATHSPIIASSFDPWEIVELKFDDTYMNVVQETNYTGERHIDNYTVYPKYLRWDGILMKLFDLTDEGNTDHRMEKLMEAATLKRKLNKLKEKGENSGETFDAMLEEFIKIKSQVGWDEKD